MLKHFSIIIIFLTISACNTSFSTKEKQEYSEKGKKIVQATFKELSSNLMQQMKMGGPTLAVPFCNVQAMPITSQLSEKYNVTIKRVSDKVRNSKNEATERELQIIEKYQNLKVNNKKTTPIIEIDNNNKKHFYAPIIINEKCLACHGKLGEKLTVKTDSIIKSLYLNDLAIDYKVGDLRGIWSIEFNK